MQESFQKILARLKSSEGAEEFSTRLGNATLLLRAAHLPERHKETKVDAVPGWTDALDKLTGKMGTGFLCALTGPRGTGKTQLAVRLIKAFCLQEQKSAAYFKTVELFMDVRETYNGERSEKKAIEKYVHPSLLVLDEAHERGETAFEDRLLTYVIDKRYDAMKDTVLISNMTKDDFLASVGSSISSRIQEAGGIIVCDWASFR